MSLRTDYTVLGRGLIFGSGCAAIVVGGTLISKIALDLNTSFSVSVISGVVGSLLVFFGGAIFLAVVIDWFEDTIKWRFQDEKK